MTRPPRSGHRLDALVLVSLSALVAVAIAGMFLAGVPLLGILAATIALTTAAGVAAAIWLILTSTGPRLSLDCADGQHEPCEICDCSCHSPNA